MKDLGKIRSLVGDVTPEQLVYVDSAVTDHIGVFMPVAGQCFYAITPEHTHPSWSFIIAFDSYCKVKLYGKIYESIPSKVFVLPAHVPHQELPSDIVSRYIAVMISAPYLESQLKTYHKSTEALFSGMSCAIDQRLVDALKEFMAEYEEEAPGYERLLEAGCLKITHLLIRLLFNLTRPNDKILHRMSVTRAIEFLNGNYGEEITVNDLAKIASLSPSHFSRVFREETAMSPVEYVLYTRLDCAKRMHGRGFEIAVRVRKGQGQVAG